MDGDNIIITDDNQYASIPSVDSYIYQEVKEKMDIILENRYIIREILREIDNDISRPFMNVYTGENRKEIPLVYTLSQEYIDRGGAIFLSLREGRENKPSIGNVQDTYAYPQGGITKEKSTIAQSKEDGKAYLEVTRKIGDLVNVENLAFSRQDEVEVIENRVVFRYDEDLIGMEFNVNYIPNTYQPHEGDTEEDIAKGYEQQGLKKGFSAIESYSLAVVSKNMDTVRCIDLILKAVLIMMRDNAEEQNNTLLQSLQFHQLEEIPMEGNDGVPELIYGRETIVTYNTTYSLDVPLMERIKNLIITRKHKI